MAEAHKLTENDAYVLRDIEAGWASCIEVDPGRFVWSGLWKPDAERFIADGLAVLGDKAEDGERIMELTTAGRAALAHHRGETK